MNQILSTELKPNKKSFEKKIWFRFQFIFSVLTLIILVSCTFLYFHQLEREENFSEHLISNYNIYRLYNTSENNSNSEPSNGLFRNY